MKIAYIENIRLPTEKAHGIQIMKMCEVFAKNGHEVRLFIVNRKDNVKSNPFEYYNVKENFSIKKIFIPNTLFFGRIGFLIQTLIFSEIASWHISDFKPDIVYSRDERILCNLILRFKNLIWESHRGSWNITTRIVMRYAKKIVVISKGLQELYNKKNPAFSHKIILAPDGVDQSQFDTHLSKEECRVRLGLPLDKKIALYAGHLYEWKGVYTLAEATKYMNRDEIVIFVGGTWYDIEHFKKIYNNEHCMIIGHKPHIDIPFYLKAADVLVLPNSAKENIGSTYTSPLKLFEYMASGTSIIASDVPAIREVLDESNSTLYQADNPYLLYKSIEKVFKNDQEIKNKSLKAKEDVKRYTWDSRAKEIISSL